MNSQIIVIGYGTKDRSAAATLTEPGTATESTVVVDLRPEAANDATAAGRWQSPWTGPGNRCSAVPRSAPPAGCHRRGPRRDRHAHRSDVRHLNPRARIVAAVREEDTSTCSALASPARQWSPPAPPGGCRRNRRSTCRMATGADPQVVICLL